MAAADAEEAPLARGPVPARPRPGTGPQLGSWGPLREGPRRAWSSHTMEHYSHKQDGHSDARHDANGPGGRYAERNEPGTEGR